MDSTDRRDDLAELRTRVEEALAADDVVVEQVRATGTAEHRTVEVVLDRASGTQGLSLDDVARLSGRVSAALDALGDHVPGVGAGSTCWRSPPRAWTARSPSPATSPATSAVSSRSRSTAPRP